jgi:His-Xaa-Ser system protein HxsD
VVCDPRVHPVDAVLAAACRATERWYVHIDRSADERLRVVLRPKEGLPDAEALRRAEGEFRNELLHHTLRLRVAEETRTEREQILARAFASQEYDPFLRAADYADDPLGIAVPWEERYGDEARGTRKKGRR